MTATSSAPMGPGMLAHAVHYALVLGGLLGLGLLLAPHALERLRVQPGPARSAHEGRVRLLRDLAAAGRLAEPGATLTDVRRVAGPVAPRGPLSAALPVALVSSAAAAGVHAAVGPVHLADQPLIGGFFLACAVAQLGWCALVLARPSRLVVEAAVVADLALLSLWAATRLSGLEPVGPWDLAAAVWEVATVVACVALLHTCARLRAPTWLDWPGLARGWFAGSVLLLGLLSLSGAGA